MKTHLRELLKPLLKPHVLGASKGEQLLLANAYRQGASPALHDTEFRNYSQNGEDGILLYLTTLLDPPRRAVEIGCGDGIECNTANLILHHGWSALLLDGDSDAILKGSAFYRKQPETARIQPTMGRTWITRDNIRSLIDNSLFDGQLGVFSVDIDGNDFWILEATEPDAEIIVVEYNNRVPADVAVTVPYREDFVAENLLGSGVFGASLAAFNTLLTRRGYRLVGANSVNTNAFFVRAPHERLPAVTVESCLTSPWARRQQKLYWEIVKRLDWETVD